MPIAFSEYFRADRYEQLLRLVQLALDEDGPDRTSNAVFPATARMRAGIVAKKPTLVAGLPVIAQVMDACVNEQPDTDPRYHWQAFRPEGEHVPAGTAIAAIDGAARHLLRAERTILNIVSRLCGIAELTSRHVQALEGTGVRLLDTRKTQPGMRCLNKYAVHAGGGVNHRFSLADMLLLKDNHIDAAGSMAGAVALLRDACPLPLEVECRTRDEVLEAVRCKADRIMLDNMDAEELSRALALVPPGIETEISGNVTLENIRALAMIGPRRPDFISVGRLTHSAAAADLSMRLAGN
jgi:nicotinate-nucleotide pyrophosphorylase (carboxylating)